MDTLFEIDDGTFFMGGRKPAAGVNAVLSSSPVRLSPGLRASGTAAVTATTARGPRPRAGPGNLYVREDKLLIELAQRLMLDGDACASRALEVVAHLRSDVDQP